MKSTKVAVSTGRAQEAANIRKIKRLGYPFVGAVSALLAVFAAADAQRGSWVIYGALSLAMAILLAGIALLAHGQAPQHVWVSAGPGGFCFCSPPAADIGVTLAMGVALSTAVVVWLHPERVAELSFRERSAAYVVPLLGAYIIATKLWSLRRPAGLTLTNAGVRGVRGGPRVDVRWDRIAKVAVNERRGIRSVCIVTAETVHVVPMHALMGDAYAIATVINYFLQNPDERGRLVDGPGALRHVDDEVRAGRFKRM